MHWDIKLHSSQFLFRTQIEWILRKYLHYIITLCLFWLYFCLCCLFAQAAGNAVKRASDNLVKAAQKAAFDKAEDDSVVVKTKFVGGIAQVRLLQNFLQSQHNSITLHCFQKANA